MNTPTTTCNERDLCTNREHSSLTCYFRYVELEYEGPQGGRIMTQQEWAAGTATVARTFNVRVVLAADANSAWDRVERHVSKVDGFVTVAGQGSLVDASKGGVYDVEVADLGGDRDDLWVVLTSYGLSPAPELGSTWSGGQLDR